MTDASQAELIADILERKGHRWKIKDGRFVQPDADDVTALLDKMQERLADEGNNSSIETGGILMRNDNGNIDVFCYLGTLDSANLIG